MSTDLQHNQAQSGREFDFTDKDFDFIRGLIKEKSGINIQPHKKSMVYSRIVRRIRALQLKDFPAYCKYLTSEAGKSETVDFINALTTNLTKFFREFHHFEHLKNAGLPKAIGDNFQQKRLRIWSAGCSTGMEAYSIAMVVKDLIPDVNKWDAKILATDIDTNVLEKGSNGIYQVADIETVPKTYHSSFVDIKGSSAHMKQSLKNLVFFKQLNLIETWPLTGPFDIIFCRNVVIYFTKETQRVLFNKMADILPVGGFLYIGHSESLHNISDRFELIGKTIYKKVK